MIKQLRAKLLLIMMSLLMIVLVGTIIFINIFVRDMGINENRESLKRISEKGKFPIYTEEGIPIDPRKIKMTDMDMAPTYIISLDENDEILSIDGNSDYFSEKTILSIIDNILPCSQVEGEVEEWQYVIQPTSNGSNLVIKNMDYSIHQIANQNLFYGSLVFGGFGLITLFIVCVYLSYVVSKPVDEAFERQKQFISDASHELKTPISIISLNTSLLEETSENSQQLQFIKNEIQRMDYLIKELLNSSKYEYKNIKLIKQKESISNACLEIALPFESIAFEKGLNYQLNIEEDIEHKVNIQGIKQVFAILIDNAIKYSLPIETVQLCLYKLNNKVYFEITNSCEEISEQDLKHIFERFYKIDKSRQQDGSYGLGLSIAQDIVHQHKGKIHVKMVDKKYINFQVIL